MAETELIALAERLGSRPFVVFAALALLLILALLITIGVGRIAIHYARRIWQRAATAWSRVATQPVVQGLERRFPIVWKVMRRLTATEYLVLHLILMLALAYAALGFISIAEAVTGEAAIVRVDLALANALHSAATPSGIEFMRAFTFLGGGKALTVLSVAVLIVLLLRRHRILAVGWAVAVTGGALLNGALKSIFERPRPSFADPIAVVAGWSFPSGHSMGTFIIVGMLAYVLFITIRSPTARLALVAAALVWIALMGFSRMYLGAHYLSDVVAGFAAGTVWLAGCVSGVEIARRRGGGRAHATVTPVPASTQIQ